MMGLDVARAARVAVVVPGAADPLALLEQHEVAKARLPQPDRHAQAPGTRPDDRDPQSSRGLLRCAHLPVPPDLL